jgi:hypothetical protein
MKDYSETPSGQDISEPVSGSFDSQDDCASCQG